MNLLWCCLCSGCFGVSKCLRKTSIYRSLEVGEWHVTKFDWWHVSHSDWGSFKTFSPRHVASFDWPKCFDFQGNTCQYPIELPASSLTCTELLMSSLTPVDVWLVFACILCSYFNDTWQKIFGFWVEVSIFDPTREHDTNPTRVFLG